MNDSEKTVLKKATGSADGSGYTAFHLSIAFSCEIFHKKREEKRVACTD